MKVLFLYPMWTSESKGINKYFAKTSGGTVIPYNLALLAAITEKAGHQAKIIDAELERIPLDSLAKMSKDFEPDIVVLTGMTAFYNIAIECAQKLREQNIKAKICVGGPHVTIVEEKAYNKEFDYGFVGDGEEAWEKFLLSQENKLTLSEVPGLMYRESGNIKKNKRAYTQKNLDIYPMAAYHLLKMGKYSMGTVNGQLPSASIQTFRGCPWKCIFCASDALETTKILKRSIKSIVDEIEHVANTYNVKHFVFIDDVLTLVRKRSIELCDEIERRNIKITFEGSTRANLLDDELVRRLKKAGLIRLSFGLETVDEDMRETMNKKVPLEAYVEANKLLGQHGIEAMNSCMIGLPGDSEENVWKTLNFLAKQRDVMHANFAIATPYPGTKFHEMATKGEGGMKLLSKNFTEYRRYGQAVTQVNELKPADLVRLQNMGFVSIYSKYWRWPSVYKRHGIIGLVLTFYRLLIMIKDNFISIVSRIFKPNKEQTT